MKSSPFWRVRLILRPSEVSGRVRTSEKHSMSDDQTKDRCASFRTTSACFGHIRCMECGSIRLRPSLSFENALGSSRGGTVRSGSLTLHEPASGYIAKTPENCTYAAGECEVDILAFLPETVHPQFLCKQLDGSVQSFEAFL